VPPWKGRTDDGYVAEAEVSVWPRQFRSADQLTAAFEARLDDVYARHGVPRPPGI
jgi:hypothetical protein